MQKITQEVGDVKDWFLGPVRSAIFEFCCFLGLLYLLTFLVAGQVGFDTWPVHPAIPLVAIFASLYGFSAGMLTAALAAVTYLAMDAPQRQIDVTRLEFLSEITVFLALIAAAALVLGVIRDRSSNRISALEAREKELEQENLKLREFAQESAAVLERHDLNQAFGATQKTLRLLHSLDAVYLSDRKGIKRDISKLLNEILPGIEFSILNAEKKAIIKSSSSTLNGMHSANLPSSPSGKGATSLVEVQAPVRLPDIIPEARWLTLSSQSGLSEPDLRVCLKVIHRCLIRDEMAFDLESMFEHRAS